MSPIPTEGRMEPRPVRLALDVSDRPTIAFRTRMTPAFGTMAFMIVEGVTLAVVLAAHLYIRKNFESWPPPRVPMPGMLIPTVGLVLLLATAFPILRLAKAAEKLDHAKTRLWLWVLAVMGLALCGVRFLELKNLGVSFSYNAYGSTSWAIIIVHLLLVVTDALETIALAMIFTLHREEPKHYTDAEDDAVYSWFTIAAWLPAFVVLYLLPYWV